MGRAATTPGSAPGATPAIAPVGRVCFGGQPAHQSLCRRSADLRNLAPVNTLPRPASPSSPKRPDHRIGAGLADHHAETLVGHRLRYGNTAPPAVVGAKSRSLPRRRASPWPPAAPILVGHQQRREKQAQRIGNAGGSPSCATGSSPCRPANAGSSASRARGRPLCLTGKHSDRPRRPLRSTSAFEKAYIAQPVFDVGAHAEPAAVWKGAGETISHRRIPGQLFSIHLHISGTGQNRQANRLSAKS